MKMATLFKSFALGCAIFWGSVLPSFAAHTKVAEYVLTDSGQFYEVCQVWTTDNSDTSQTVIVDSSSITATGWTHVNVDSFVFNHYGTADYELYLEFDATSNSTFFLVENKNVADVVQGAERDWSKSSEGLPNPLGAGNTNDIVFRYTSPNNNDSLNICVKVRLVY